MVQGSSGHRLFISVFMIASKVICDDTYSNKSWSIVGHGMFQLREINQMEHEMCQYLDRELNIELSTLKEFEDMVHKDFPTRVRVQSPRLALVKRLHQNPPPPPPSIPTHPAKAYLTPPPDTSEPLYSQSTSPASSVSPQTPVSMIDNSVKIVSHNTYPGLSIVEQAALDFAVMKQKMFAFVAPSKL
jgi:hypothetical protein